MFGNLFKNPVLVFIYLSFFVIFIVTGLGMSGLRIILQTSHLLIVFFYYFQWFKVGKEVVWVFVLLIYVAFQGFILQAYIDNVEYLQAIVLILLYLSFFISARSMSTGISNNLIKQIPRYLIFLLPILLISFTEWSITRSPGIFGNPNLSAHTLCMILPFCLLTRNTRLFFVVLGVICFTGLVLFASRSAMLAVILGLIGFFLSSKVRSTIRIPILFSFTFLSVFISYQAIDILKYLIEHFSSLFNEAETRLFYTGYNGRDLIRTQAFERLESGNIWLGLGFNAAKFEGADHTLSTHDGFLELILRLGIGGTALFAGLMFYLLHTIIRIENMMLRGASLMSFIIILSLSTSSSTFFVFNYYFYYFILIFCLAAYSPKVEFVANKHLK